MKLNQAIDAATLPEPLEVWGWEMGGFGERQVTLEASAIPREPGRISIVYGDPRCWVFDLAWGPFNTAGSIRATFKVDKVTA